jgi:hypothetical protein
VLVEEIMRANCGQGSLLGQRAKLKLPFATIVRHGNHTQFFDRINRLAAIRVAEDDGVGVGSRHDGYMK